MSRKIKDCFILYPFIIGLLVIGERYPPKRAAMSDIRFSTSVKCVHVNNYIVTPDNAII